MDSKARKVTPVLQGAFAFLLVLGLCFGISCSSPKPSADVLEDSVENILDAYKRLDRGTLDNFSEFMDIGELEQFGIRPTEFCRAFFAGFDYSINNIYVGEDDACVNVTLHAKTYPTFEIKLLEAIDQLEAKNVSRTISNDDFKDLYGEAVMSSLEKTELSNISGVTFTYQKNGNAWKPDADSFAILASALMQAER